MIELEESLSRLLAVTEPLPAEEVPLSDALGRVLCASVRSPIALPPFTRSAMDGYAVRAADVTGDGAVLRVVAPLHAGDASGGPLRAGEATPVTTGAPLPPGADTVVPVEDTAPSGDGRIRLSRSSSVGAFVRHAGEDIAAGAPLAGRGEPLAVGTLAALAAAGVGTVPVPRRARVTVLITGDEVVPPGGDIGAGQVPDANGPVLVALLRAAGADVRGPLYVADTVQATRRAVADALEGTDLLVLSGGVSVGSRDHVKDALAAAGVQRLFWRVRIKPGKPTWGGHRGGTVVVGLPGNPLAVLVGTLVLLRPVLARMHGHPARSPERGTAVLAAPAAPADGRTTFLAARLARDAGGGLLATPLAEQGSHRSGGLAGADCFVRVPHDAGQLPVGAQVEVEHLRDVGTPGRSGRGEPAPCPVTAA